MMYSVRLSDQYDQPVAVVKKALTPRVRQTSVGSQCGRTAAVRIIVNSSRNDLQNMVEVTQQNVRMTLW